MKHLILLLVGFDGYRVAVVARTWLRITVELLAGMGQKFQPPPGRVFLVSPSNTFGQLAQAINIGFARWDHAHLYRFSLPTGEVIGLGDEDAPADELVDEIQVGSLLRPGNEFEYVFDFGDDWTHSCRVEALLADPAEEYGGEPEVPVPIWSWGTIPDQYGREGPED